MSGYVQILSGHNYNNVYLMWQGQAHKGANLALSDRA